MPSLSHRLPEVRAPGFAGRDEVDTRERLRPMTCVALILTASAVLWSTIFYVLGLVL